MKVCILRGKDTIGGATVLIESSKARILIDYGPDLPDKNEPHKSFELEELKENPVKLTAVFITHSHADHCGLINNIPRDIKVYMEEKSKEIYNITASYMKDVTPIKRDIETFKLEREYNLENQEKIIFEDMIITPLIADHSSYNACMYLIECEGKYILHTGDFRNNGMKKDVLDKVLNYLKDKKISILIIEGTSLGRNSSKDKFNDLVTINTKEMKLESEKDLEEYLVNLIKVNDTKTQYNQIFFLQSSTNIDRTNALCRATLKCNKKFVIDMPTSKLIPICLDKINVDNKNVFTWIPKSHQIRHSKEKFDFNTGFFPYFVMQVKTSMYEDIEKIMKTINPSIKHACLIYSMWDGYIERDEKTRKFIEKVKSLGIDFGIIHVSGHGNIETLKYVEDYLNPDYTMVIHTKHREEGKVLFKKYYESEKIEI